MEHKKKLIHITKMPIRWGDMDAYGHVNNTVYFRYMEQARVNGSRRWRYPFARAAAGPVIINASCTFLIPMNYPGTVEVRTLLARLAAPVARLTSKCASRVMIVFTPKGLPRWSG
jgi:acyl-CoA thioester hydrolase